MRRMLSLPRWPLVGVLLLFLWIPACSDDESTPADDGGTDPGTTGASIEGVVTELGGSMALPGVEVTVQPWFADPIPAKENPAILAATRTDARGRFVLDGLAAGQYLLVVDGTTLVSDFDPSWAYSLQTMGFTLSSDQALTLEDPIRLRGWSLNEGQFYDGQAPVDIQTPFLNLRLGVGNVVYPVQARDRIVYLSFLAPDIAAAPMPAGVYPIAVYSLMPQGTRFDTPALTEFAPWGLTPDEGTTLEVHALDPARNEFRLAGTVSFDMDTGWFLPEEPFLDRATQFFLMPAAFDLSGRVVDDNLDPLQDVLVEIVPGDGYYSPEPPSIEGLSVRTDANGEFMISGARVALPVLHVVWSGMEGTYDLYEPVPSGGGELEEDIQLVEPNRVTVTVEGTVTDIHGAPVAGAQVAIDPEGMILAEDTIFRQAAAPQQSLYTTMSDAEGAYRFEAVVLDYLEDYRVWAYFQEGTEAYGYIWFSTPGFVGNGTTLTEDLVLCDYMWACGEQGGWSLEGTVLTLTEDSEVCFGGEESPSSVEYEVLALSNGVVVLDPAEGPNWLYERVGETGPDGVSAENIPGLYRVRRDVSLKDSGAQYILMRPNGSLRFWLSTQSDAGTYTIDDASLMLTELWPEEREAEAYGYVLSGDRLAIYQGSTMLYSLERCVLGDGTELEGVWISDDPSDWPQYTAIFYAGEYVFLQNDMIIIVGR